MPEINGQTYPNKGGRHYRDKSGALLTEAEWLERKAVKQPTSVLVPPLPASVNPVEGDPQIDEKKVK